MLRSSALYGVLVRELYFGVTKDGRTYGGFQYSSERDRELLLKPDEAESDAEGKYRVSSISPLEYREEGSRFYETIDWLERCMSKLEQRISARPVIEAPEFRAQFNREKHVWAESGLLRDDLAVGDVIDRATDASGRQPSDRSELFSADEKQDDAVDAVTETSSDGEITIEQVDHLQETMTLAAQHNVELQAIVEEMPKWARQTVVGRLISGGQFVVDKQGNLLIAFNAENGPEFRTAHENLFNSDAVSIREYRDGQYAVELDPESIPGVLASTRVLFTETWNTELSNEEQMKLLSDATQGHGNLRSPERWNDDIDSLNTRLQSFVQRVSPEVTENTVLGCFAAGLGFRSDGRREGVYFIHPSESAVREFLGTEPGSDGRYGGGKG